MNFSEALELLKNGFAVTRKGWNGKDQFIYLVGIGRYSPCTKIAEKIADVDGNVPYGAYIAIKTSQGNVVPWTASHTDILSEDWVKFEI